MLKTTKVELDLPDFKFQIGDIVVVQNSENDKTMSFLIKGMKMRGSWEVEFTEESPPLVNTFIADSGVQGVDPTMGYEEAYYATISCKGSFCDCKELTVLEAGKDFLWDKQRLEHRGTIRED